ncbi:hypothetical protein HJD18_01780 [Thermoleophilia bacterium SCSIO 60948]|nr:hypothetical protein HJD18_01780 [Thermoleophilia bacterium SCSIO 60948]
MGGAAVLAPVAAAILVLALVSGVIIARSSTDLLASAVVAALPWTVAYDSVLPPQVGTVAALAFLGLGMLTFERRRRVSLALVAAAMVFSVAAAYHFAGFDATDDVVQLTKYLGFVVAIYLVTATDVARRIAPYRRAILVSGALAVLSAVGLSLTGTVVGVDYYGLGEATGFATSPHQLALVGLLVGGALASRSIDWLQRSGGLLVAIVAAVATGVRQALVAAGAMVVALVWRERGIQVLGLIAAITMLVLVSGTASALETRLTTATSQDALDAGGANVAGVQGLVESRSTIWLAALDGWRDSDGPTVWIGAGANSVQEFELERLGVPFVAHSDAIEVIVQLGVLASLAWAILWAILFRSGADPVVLIPLLVFAVLNGVIGYFAPLVFGLAIAAHDRPARLRT